ncbi:MAG: hypothetical protein HZC54_12860 [Verrucomicrobia bacterium]|nr:hypothetical protein [Verrucomicrobiota bacterium]
MLCTRRQFFKSTAATAVVLGGGGLSLLSRLPRVSAQEARLPFKAVQFSPEIEPLVRLLEDTPRERLLEEVASRIRRGLGYRDVLAALLLAGVRNIQPRPVGFKFHAVLVVNSAHLASVASPESDRWLPIFWALDYFKSSQARDVSEGDWTMSVVNESAVPPKATAKRAFIEAMERWDEPAADAAVSGFARSVGAQEIFDVFCRLGARDFRDIGHKAIYVANSWRTLRAIGWQHAEPVLRSLAYGLLDRRGDPNPAQSDLPADRPGRRNAELAKKIRAEWREGKVSGEGTRELLATLRERSAQDASEKVAELLNRGVAPQSVWDALFQGVGELLMRRPGLIALHAVTSTNALHFAYQTTGDDETRRFLMLQNAAFLPLFRGDAGGLGKARIDELKPADLKRGDKGALDDIFADVTNDRLRAARKTLAYLRAQGNAVDFINAARRLVFLKGNDSHDYKFSSAALEDYFNVSPSLRDRFLAASIFNLPGSADEDNGLVNRTRAALS